MVAAVPNVTVIDSAAVCSAAGALSERTGTDNTAMYVAAVAVSDRTGAEAGKDAGWMNAPTELDGGEAEPGGKAPILPLL